jgi:hypothetical protein
MVPKLLRRLAGQSASSSDDETLAGQVPAIEPRDRAAGPFGDPLPSAWVKMHVWRRDGGKCVLCGGQERVWVDYIVPVWERGSTTEQNMRLVCEGCRHRPNGTGIRRKKWRS